jgi:hypothetical protein
MTREEFWQQVYLNAINTGWPANYAVQAADSALQKFDERTKHGEEFMADVRKKARS